jgi:hypothetical protein
MAPVRSLAGPAKRIIARPRRAGFVLRSPGAASDQPKLGYLNQD